MSQRYGRSIGPFFWRYNLTLGAEFNRAVLGQTLRWWGVSWGQWGIGIMRREKSK